jgi:CysZ protein
MLAILRAPARALRSLLLPGLARHFLWPALVAMVAWVAAGLAFWGRLSHGLAGLLRGWAVLSPHLPEGGAGERGIATTIHLALYFLSVPMMLVTAVLLLELVALPIILDRVAAVEYPSLERRRGGSQWTSIRRTLRSFLLAATVIVLSLPLWLVPGFGAALSYLVSSWLNYRSFSYDVLMNHADAAELQSLPASHRWRLLLLALLTGTLTLVPIANLLFAVPFTGLAFAHYLLAELEIRRTA